MSRRIPCAALLLGLLPAGTALCLEWHSIPSLRTRSLPTMIVDTANQRAVMFGGGNYSRYHNDVWEFPLDTVAGYFWRPVRVAGPLPPGRNGHSAVYDPVGGRMLVFGGLTASGKQNDLWSLDLSGHTWQQLTPSGALPGPRSWHEAIYCAPRRSMIVVGGRDAAPYDEVHELLLDSLVWRVISVGGTHPTPRWSHVMQYDGEGNRLVIFGGENVAGQMMNDAWTLDLTEGNECWTQLYPSGSPPGARSTATSCYDPETRTFYVFGGFEYPGYIVLLNDLHALDLASPAWTELRPSGPTPSERRGAAGIHDPYNRNLLLFAGQSYDGCENDAYYLGTGQVGVAEWQPAAPGRTGPLLVGPSVSARPVRFRYSLAEPGEIRVRIVDAAGRVVRHLSEGRTAAASGWLQWDGNDGRGRKAQAGSYFCYLETDGSGVSRRFVLAE